MVGIFRSIKEFRQKIHFLWSFAFALQIFCGVVLLIDAPCLRKTEKIEKKNIELELSSYNGFYTVYHQLQVKHFQLGQDVSIIFTN